MKNNIGWKSPYIDKIEKARLFGMCKHEGQRDDSGQNYWGAHVFPVGEAMCRLTSDEDVVAAAYLHDTIEDTDTTYKELVKEFGKRVANLVMEVTHEGEKDNYGRYFPRLKTPEGIMIKLVDRASNISRMECWNKERRAQYIKKTKFWKDGTDRPYVPILEDKNEF